MIKEFIFTVGLPGCGKSSYLERNYPSPHTFIKWCEMEVYACDGITFDYEKDGQEFIQSCIDKDLVLISADEVKTKLDGYTDIHPEVVHEESVQIARQFVFELSRRCDGTIIMDGGGINHHYTEDILSYIRGNCPGVKITELFFDTPIEICLKRIEGRGRKVPRESIFDKNQMLIGCINRYKRYVDNFVRVDYYTNKYVMLDMDGTIAGYSNVRQDEDGNSDFVNGELFKHLRPNLFIINFIKEHYDMKNVYICTACANSIAWQEKCEWLDKYFPEIPVENRYWCGNKDYKYVFVKQFAEHMGWNRNEVVLIDDYHYTIDKCKKVSINCIHPSNIEALADQYAIFS